VQLRAPIEYGALLYLEMRPFTLNAILTSLLFAVLFFFSTASAWDHEEFLAHRHDYHPFANCPRFGGHNVTLCDVHGCWEPPVLSFLRLLHHLDPEEIFYVQNMQCILCVARGYCLSTYFINPGVPRTYPVWELMNMLFTGVFENCRYGALFILSLELLAEKMATFLDIECS
jgi:hypothetical protein